MDDQHTQHDIEAKQSILSNIEKFGCHLFLIEPDNYLPGFVYSIGLYKKYGHSEIICFGLKTEVMASIINHACDLVKSGESLTTNRLYQGFLEGYDIQFVNVDQTFYPNYLGYAGWFYDMSFDFPVLQLIWQDKQNYFPWDENFNPDWKFKQPLLDRSTDFKFYEQRNLGVYTTKQAFEGDPILYVYHNEDGDWQFHTSLEPEIADSKLVCLEEITKLDPSINEIYHLQYGWSAWRSCRYDEWQYAEDEITNNTGSIPNNEQNKTVELSELIKDITKIDSRDITSAWNWLIAGYKNVLMVTKFGDMFLVDTNDEISWLDTGAGTLTKVASSPVEFEELIKDNEKTAHWFMTDLYLELQEQKIFLRENEVYSFQNLPLLGGQYSIDNIKPTDISVHFATCGQMCEMLKDIPDGTKVQLKVEEAKKKPWWKF